MTARAYPKYKDSGIEWLGEIPEHWELRRLKTVAILGYGDSLAADDRVPGLCPVYGSNGVVGEHDRANTKAPCLIVGRKGSFGKVAYSNIPCFAIDTTYFIDDRFTSNDLRWLYYSLQWLRLDSFSKDSAVPGLSREDAYNNVLPFCPLPEQRSIAAFLDRETARIDALIEKKRRQIELLQEKRSALISHAVTKGLDPNVKMKDSGIEWLGEIPKHWFTKRIKHTTYVKGRIGWQGLKSDEFIDEGPYLVTGTDFINGRVNWTTCYHVSEERYKEDPYIQLKENDLLITKDGTIGKTAIVRGLPSYATLNSGVFVVRPTSSDYVTDFLYWVLNSDVFSGFIDFTKTGTTISHLYQNVFVDFSFPIPTLDEQHAIAAFLDRETARIDALIEKVEKSIELLREYRTALISAAVTGKIDVRGEVGI